ncbi:MAG: hypothetical protein UIQ67_07680, partial [Bacteroidales bacterium]|nr:hypothetical protein [Bacteroidales bacterium]
MKIRNLLCLFAVGIMLFASCEEPTEEELNNNQNHQPGIGGGGGGSTESETTETETDTTGGIGDNEEGNDPINDSLDYALFDCIHTFNHPTQWMLHADYSPDGSRIISVAAEEVFHSWDANNGSVVQTYNGHTNCVTMADFNPQGHRLVSVSVDSTLR